ncbi:MAG: hypothetical protein AAGI25_11330 [Bacteroidota bacterium]
MKYSRLFSLMFIYASTALISSCSDNDDNLNPQIDATADDIFVLEVRNSQVDVSGAMLVFDSLPSGKIDPAIIGGTASLAQFGEGVVFGKAVYRKRNFQNDVGISKLELNATGQLAESGFIAGALHFQIISETKGYYWNSDLNDKALQIFDPTAMQRTGEMISLLP